MRIRTLRMALLSSWSSFGCNVQQTVLLLNWINTNMSYFCSVDNLKVSPVFASIWHSTTTPNRAHSTSVNDGACACWTYYEIFKNFLHCRVALYAYLAFNSWWPLPLPLPWHYVFSASFKTFYMYVHVDFIESIFAWRRFKVPSPAAAGRGK